MLLAALRRSDGRQIGSLLRFAHCGFVHCDGSCGQGRSGRDVTIKHRFASPAGSPSVQREAMEFDVVDRRRRTRRARGRLPSRAARAARRQREPSVCVVEKGAAIGAHIVSGAVLEPRALLELFPDCASAARRCDTPVATDRFLWLRDERAALDVPGAFVPRLLRNHGNYIVSLGDICRWLGERGRSHGVQRLSRVRGHRGAATTTAASRASRPATWVEHATARTRPTFQPGYELRSRYVVFAEGCRGSLGKLLEQRFELRGPRRSAALRHRAQGDLADRSDEASRRRGRCTRPAGRSTMRRRAAVSSITLRHSLVYLGLIVSLGYTNPHLDPFAEFQRWKQHPRIRELLEGGERISYGARAVNKGGLQSLPDLHVPGGVLVGCEAGFLNGAQDQGLAHGHEDRNARGRDDPRGARASVRRRRGRGASALRRARARLVGVGRALRGAQLQRPASRSSGRRWAARSRSSSRTCCAGRVPFTLRNRDRPTTRGCVAPRTRRRSTTRSRTESCRSIGWRRCSCRARRTRKTSPRI